MSVAEAGPLADDALPALTVGQRIALDHARAAEPYAHLRRDRRDYHYDGARTAWDARAIVVLVRGSPRDDGVTRVLWAAGWRPFYMPRWTPEFLGVVPHPEVWWVPV